MKVDYFSAADTAKLVRAALKRSFPGTRFSVRSKTYSAGASIDVSWMDAIHQQASLNNSRGLAGMVQAVDPA